MYLNNILLGTKVDFGKHKLENLLYVSFGVGLIEYVLRKLREFKNVWSVCKFVK